MPRFLAHAVNLPLLLSFISGKPFFKNGDNILTYSYYIS